jgi:putative long chain acyl-CoA synthase
LRTGASITEAGLTEAVRNMPVGLGPDIVHVVGELTLSTSYRPMVSALRAAGFPKPGRHTWYFDTEAGQFKRLTAAVRTELTRGHR